MAAVVIAIGVCSSICCSSPFAGIFLAPAKSYDLSERLKKVLPENIADFLPDRPLSLKGEYDSSQDEEDELQSYRNELGAIYAADDAEQAIWDQMDENSSEDAANFLLNQRGRTFYEEEMSTACSSDFFSNDLKPDCGDDAIKKFKLVKCGINQYKYDYTCLRGVNAPIGQPQETCPVTAASIASKGSYLLDKGAIDLRTMYRHNVSCTIGTSSCHSNRTNTNGEQVSTQNIGVTTPLSQFRYDFGKNLGDEDETKYNYKCLEEATSGNCETYWSKSVAMTEPEKLVTDSAMGLQTLEVDCPGENYALTQFQLKSGSDYIFRQEDESNVKVSPFPDEGNVGVYQYQYTCCKMGT
jgi:hypothetical protein